MYCVSQVGEEMDYEESSSGARRTRIEKLREHQYREGYARSLERKRVEWDGENNVEQKGVAQ